MKGGAGRVRGKGSTLRRGQRARRLCGLRGGVRVRSSEVVGADEPREGAVGAGGERLGLGEMLLPSLVRVLCGSATRFPLPPKPHRLTDLAAGQPQPGGAERRRPSPRRRLQASLPRKPKESLEVSSWQPRSRAWVPRLLDKPPYTASSNPHTPCPGKAAPSPSPSPSRRVRATRPAPLPRRGETCAFSPRVPRKGAGSRGRPPQIREADGFRDRWARGPCARCRRTWAQLCPDARHPPHSAARGAGLRALGASPQRRRQAGAGTAVRAPSTPPRTHAPSLARTRLPALGAPAQRVSAAISPQREASDRSSWTVWRERARPGRAARRDPGGPWRRPLPGLLSGGGRRARGGLRKAPHASSPQLEALGPNAAIYRPTPGCTQAMNRLLMN